MSVLRAAPSLTSAFRSQVGQEPQRPAIAVVADPADPATARWWTYQEVDDQALVVAAQLAGQLQAGSRVLLLYPNGADFVTALLGCLYAGMIAVPSSMPGRYQHDQRRVRNIARDAQVGGVLTASTEMATVSAWAAETGLHVPVVATDELSNEPLPQSLIHPADRETGAVLQYTSGSTADPKGTVITHGNILANAGTVTRSLHADRDTVFGGWIPNFHDMGLMGIVLPPLLIGGRTVLMSPATFLRRPASWLQLVDRYDVAISAGPSFAYDLCVRRTSAQEVAELDLSRWRYAVNGSEPVNPSVLTSFIEKFQPAGFAPQTLTPSYGLAEATLLVSGCIAGPPRTRLCDVDALAEHRVVPPLPGEDSRELVSCGVPVDVEARIVEPDGREAAEGKVGEIWLRGPAVASGYWANPEATQATFGGSTGGESGFLRTGDLGALVDGELYVTGRIKDMIIVRGRNIYPHDIEAELQLQHQALDDRLGAVFTVPARDGDDRLVVVHEVRAQPAQAELAELGAAVRVTVGREFGLRADSVVLLRRGGVRRTTSGKIQRAVMRKLFLDGELKPLYADGYRAAELVGVEAR